MGLTIPQVAMLTGHKTWVMLRRYTNITPNDVLQAAKVATEVRNHDEFQRLFEQERNKYPTRSFADLCRLVAKPYKRDPHWKRDSYSAKHIGRVLQEHPPTP
jgi:hypothetical protein